jgi:hypothetical protein
VDVTLKERIKKIGKLYIFQKHLVFEYHVFGMDSKEVMPLEKVKQIKAEEKKGSLKIDGRVFTKIKDFAQLHGLLTALWEGNSSSLFCYSLFQRRKNILPAHRAKRAARKTSAR